MKAKVPVSDLAFDPGSVDYSIAFPVDTGGRRSLERVQVLSRG